MKRYIGLRNIVTSKTDWKRLILYELDGHDESQYHAISRLFAKMNISWLSYKSLHGFHFVGLTPISATHEGLWHDVLQRTVPEYFSGQTLRISLKESEKQELIDFSLETPYLEKLAGMYAKRFNIPKSDIPVYGEMPKYSCVFEKYWTDKI